MVIFSLLQWLQIGRGADLSSSVQENIDGEVMEVSIP